MLSRFENARVFSDHLVTTVTSDAQECIIDIDDRTLCISNQNAFTGVGEDAGGELEFFIGKLAFSDVVGKTNRADQATVDAYRGFVGFNPDQIAVVTC